MYTLAKDSTIVVCILRHPVALPIGIRLLVLINFSLASLYRIFTSLYQHFKMKSAVVAAAFIGAAMAAPQGVTDKIAPEGGIPAGCSASYDGKFEITVAQVTYQKRDLQVSIRAPCPRYTLANRIVTETC